MCSEVDDNSMPETKNQRLDVTVYQQAHCARLCHRIPPQGPSQPPREVLGGCPRFWCSLKQKS